MNNKIITGELIHNTWRESVISQWPDARTWEDLSERTQQEYNDLAKALMVKLNICSSCGKMNGDLYEVACEMWCGDCVEPPVERLEPKIQLMHMIFNADNEPVGIITPPAGVTLEDYKAQLVEKMKYIRFLLHLNHHQTIKAETIAELSSLINTHIVPTYLGRIPYYVHVYKKDDVIGYGSYVRSTTHTEITVESGAAKGLLDALREYAPSQTTQEPAEHEN